MKDTNTRIRELVNKLPVMVDDVKSAYTEKAVRQYDNVLLENLHLLVDDLPALPSIMLDVNAPDAFWNDACIQNNKGDSKLFIYVDRENGVYKYVTHVTDRIVIRKNGDMPCFASRRLSDREKCALLKHWKVIKENTIYVLKRKDSEIARRMCKEAEDAHAMSEAVDAWEF